MVYQLVNNLEEWPKWSPWHKIDTNMKVAYFGGGKGLGGGYTWDSEVKEAGKGKLTIEAISEFDSLLTKLEFDGMGTSYSTYYFAPKNDATEVTWTLDSDFENNLVSRYFGLMMDKWIGKDYEKGLSSLKSIAEAQVAELLTRADGVKETEMQAFYAMVISDTVSMMDLDANMMAAFRILDNEIKAQKLTSTGDAFAFYTEFPDGKIIFEAGYPVDSVGDSNTKVKFKEFDATKVLTKEVYGDYSKVNTGYEAINQYLKAKGKTQNGSPWESYPVDPETEPDTSKWLTRIHFPIN
jgi:effector-binding domain-containing protein